MSRRLLGIAVATLCLTGVVACAKAPRTRAVKGGDVAAGTGTLTEARKYLEGRWNLESFTVYPPGKDPLQAKG